MLVNVSIYTSRGHKYIIYTRLEYIKQIRHNLTLVLIKHCSCERMPRRALPSKAMVRLAWIQRLF